MAAPAIHDPKHEYQQRLDERLQTVSRAQARDGQLSMARGLVFLSGVTLLILLCTHYRLSPWWLLLPGVVFMLLVIVHARIVGQLDRARHAVKYFQVALDRLDERWIDHGPSGERYANPDHMYADDLDVFGRGSLFQLISTARTRLGEDTLAGWLAAAANAKEVQERQAAIDELRSKLDLREDLALLDAEVHDELDQNCLIRWSGQPPQPVSRQHRVLAAVLATAAVAGLAGWAFLGIGPSLFAAAVILEALLTFVFRKRIKQMAKIVDEAGSGLDILSKVMELIEREQFTSSRLVRIRAALDTEGQPPSRHVARLDRLIQSIHNSLQNQFFAPIAFVLCLPIHLVHAVETWRARIGLHIPEWLEAVGEFEALSALAGYAFEHPQDPFPEVVEKGPLVDGEGIGHPLIPEQQCIRNVLCLGQDVGLVLVSGSNMSGKSTLLRTVGTNVVLALAGAPVRAKRLRLSPVQIGTAMRINDSLQDGKSLFYAVVSRLKSVVELCGRELPLLFLLDEILQGTNSHDRRVGAEGVIRKLVDSGAIGLVTTHDLALTEIVDTLGSRGMNIHFEDHLVDGKMTFDYQIRPGVVRKSNALELMRMMGLDVGRSEPSSR